MADGAGRRLALVVGVASWMGGGGLLAGCRGCSFRGSAESAKGVAAARNAGAADAKKTSVVTRSRLHDLPVTPTMAVLRSGNKVWMWVDGRSTSVSRPFSEVSWSPKGFEFEVDSGFTKVLAPGGSFYFRIESANPPTTRPVVELFSEPSSPPPGFSIDYIDGAGGSRVQAVLNGPRNRRVRLGLYREVPDGQVWLEGELPTTGQASPPLKRSQGFRWDAEKRFAHAAPADAGPLESGEVPPEDLKKWVTAAQTFHKGGPPLTAGYSIRADFDRDGADEDVLCLDGEIGILDPRCLLVEREEDEVRMYAVGLPWTAGGNHPIAFTLDGAPYLMMVSPTESRLAYGFRYYGAGWIVEPIM